jgi:hypothetical protein
MTDIGIMAIDVVFALAVVAATSCLAYLVYLAVREHRQVQAGVSYKAAGPAAESDGAVGAARGRTVTSLRPSVARHHVASS